MQQISEVEEKLSDPVPEQLMQLVHCSPEPVSVKIYPLRRQSAKLFSSRRNWDSPNPSPAGECAPPPFGSGGMDTLAGERGGGGVPIQTRGHPLLWYFM